MDKGFCIRHRTAISLCLSIGIVAAAVVLPYVSAPGERNRRRCQENLTKIDGAKEQWALENCQVPGALPGVANIATGKSGYLKEFPVCPSGGSYLINPIGEYPQCSSGLPGHDIVDDLCTAVPVIEGP